MAVDNDRDVHEIIPAVFPRIFPQAPVESAMPVAFFCLMKAMRTGHVFHTSLLAVDDAVDKIPAQTA